MFLTVDILRRLNACEQGVKYIERFYPNGAELIDIINDRHINKDFLHWGREYLTVNSTELEAYKTVCGIVNTPIFWYCVDVVDSNHVVHSKQVKNSIGVFNSIEVSDSSDIIHGENVRESHQIFYSSFIDRGLRVVKSSNVYNSSNIFNSNTVNESKSVIDSMDIFTSSEIVNCKSVTDSHFCQNCTNIKHCLFCEGISNVEYHLFNKPVSKERYEMFVRQYLQLIKGELTFVHDWPKNILVEVHIAPTRKFDDWYSVIPESFWKWAATLPGYDELLLYKITMLSEFILGGI